MTQARKTPHPDLARLKDTGALTVGAASITCVDAGSDRLVIGFFEGNDKGAWLRETCTDTALDLIAITAPTSADLDADAVAGLLQAIAQDHTGPVTLCASGLSGHFAIKAAVLFADPILVVFDLPLSHDPQETRPLLAGLGACQTGFVFHDPFYGADLLLRDSPAALGIHWLKGFGLLSATLNRLWRMKHLPSVLPAALTGQLQPAYFYKLMRSRRNYRFYRTGIEAALAARKQPVHQSRFRTLFRAHLQAQDPEQQFAALQRDAAAARPDHPDAWAVAGHADPADTAQTWPSLGGNVWMLDVQSSVLRYLSDRWHDVPMGYEERAGVTLAQTSPLALGMISFGHGAQVARDPVRRFPWHVVTSDLGGHAPAIGATNEATCLCEHALQTREALPTIMTFAQPKAGTTAQEETRGTAAYDALLKDVRKGQSALAAWGKSLHVDRMRLSLLSGSPSINVAAASDHYDSVAQDLSKDIVAETGQSTPPVIVVVQSAGTCRLGRSEVILAEGQFDLDNPALPAIVASPAYPWGVMDGTTGTPSIDAAMMMDELSMHAVMAHQAGQRWFCPMMREATLDGRKIMVEFATMADLVLDDGAHGFHLLGHSSVPLITKAQVTSPNRITLHLDRDMPPHSLSLAYAWGFAAPYVTAPRYANHGALRDAWATQSRTVPGRTLHRYALAARVPVTITQ